MYSNDANSKYVIQLMQYGIFFHKGLYTLAVNDKKVF